MEALMHWCVGVGTSTMLLLPRQLSRSGQGCEHVAKFPIERACGQVMSEHVSMWVSAKFPIEGILHEN